MLSIVLDLNILVWCITIFDLILISALVELFICQGIYLYNSTGLRFYIFGLLPDSSLCDSIVTGECTVLILPKYVEKVCALSFGFWSCCFKVYIHLRIINTQRGTTTPYYSWLSLSWISLLCWYYKYTLLRFVWYRLVFIQLIIKFVSIYPASKHRDKQQHHLTWLTSYHLVIADFRDCINGQPVVVREILTLI